MLDYLVIKLLVLWLRFVGDNQIVIVSGANDTLCEEDLQQAMPFIKSSKVVLFQFETPIETTVCALKMCEKFEGNFRIIFSISFIKMMIIVFIIYYVTQMWWRSLMVLRPFRIWMKNFLNSVICFVLMRSRYVSYFARYATDWVHSFMSYVCNFDINWELLFEILKFQHFTFVVYRTYLFVSLFRLK